MLETIASVACKGEGMVQSTDVCSFTSAGFTGRDFNPRQRPEPGLPELQSCRVQTSPQSLHDPVINTLQSDEGTLFHNIFKTNAV